MFQSGNRRPATMVGVLTLFAIVLAVSSPARAGADDQHLQGFWTLEFTLDDPNNGFLPGKFQLLANFMFDGNLVVTSNLPTLPVGPLPFDFPKFSEGIGHGAWVRTSQGTFLINVLRVSKCAQSVCLLPYPPNVFKQDDAIGWAIGKAEVVQDAKNGKMKGRVQLQLLAPDRSGFGPALLGDMTGTLEKVVP